MMVVMERKLVAIMGGRRDLTGYDELSEVVREEAIVTPWEVGEGRFNVGGDGGLGRPAFLGESSQRDLHHLGVGRVLRRAPWRF